VGVHELQMQNRKFEGWFQSFGTQLSESQAQVTDLQRTMQGQQADVAKLRGEVSSAVSSLKSDMNTRLDDQLQRIEALLSKKSRHTPDKFASPPALLSPCVPTLFGLAPGLATFHCVGALPVITANIYGYPGPTFPDARERTDLLFEVLTREIVLGRTGVRAIVGDYNHHPDVLHQISIWRMHGWQEVQVIASERWGHAPQPTSKGAAFRDHIFVSPEAAALLNAVEVRDIFAEHSTVIASLSLDGVFQAQTWPLPSEIPWAHIDIAAWQASAPASGANSSDATTWLKQFASGFEASLDRHGKSLPSARMPHRCHGRASRTKPMYTRVVTPPSASREGEEVISHSLLSLEVKRWFQQLRRLQQSPRQRDSRMVLPNGGSIGKSSSKARLTPFRVAFEAWSTRQRHSVLRERYAHDSNLLFRDLRDDKPEQVQLDSDLDTRGTSEWRLDGQPVFLASPDHCVATISPPKRIPVDAELEQDLPSEHWNRVINFAAVHLPTGPDGFALADLRNMPDSLAVELLSFLSSIEAGVQVWPEQWLLGFVCGLKKPNGALGADGYRPIVLLSIVYRCWSGLRARQLLKHFKDVMPATALGFLPGRETTDFWWQLEAIVELSCQGGLELCGFSTDIVKAFNALPREPIWRIAAQIGFPSSVLVPWRDFLGRLQRRFLIRQCVSEPLRSHAGFPEGCALSTTAMNIACLVFHRYLEVFGRSISPHSYVDNWACTAPSVGQLAHGLNLCSCVMDLLDLTPDDGKTYVWAVQPDSRKQLKALGLPLCTHARELGGVLSFGRATRNLALVERCQNTKDLFARLRRSPATLKQKLSVLPLKFWARALHGISICPLAEAQVHSLRCSATKALRINPAGSSSTLRLSVHSNLDADPGFFQLWATIRDLRRMCSKHDSVLSLWTSFVRGFRGELQHGPFSKLLSVLNRIGWQIAHPPQVVDQHGLELNLLQVPDLTLRRLLEQAWLDQTATEHRHRKTMHDLFGIDRALLRHSERGLPPLQLARLNALRSGAFLFDDAHSKFDLSITGMCVQCGVADTPEHRVCWCPRFQQARTGVEWVCRLWPDLPSCTTHHLLAPSSPHVPLIRKCLQATPDLSGNFASSTCCAGFQHLFTDGSCIYPEVPELALASWGVMHAGTGQIIGCGP
ncbi:unnamed protein product, partial [Symbiodinium necroappetens]